MVIKAHLKGVSFLYSVKTRPKNENSLVDGNHLKKPK